MTTHYGSPLGGCACDLDSDIGPGGFHKNAGTRFVTRNWDEVDCRACLNEHLVSDGAGGQVVAGSLDDPGVGTWDPSDDPESELALSDHADDEARAAHGA